MISRGKVRYIDMVPGTLLISGGEWRSLLVDKEIDGECCWLTWLELHTGKQARYFYTGNRGLDLEVSSLTLISPEGE